MHLNDRLSRRRVLGMSSGIAVASVLAACGASSDAPAPTSVPGTPTSGGQSATPTAAARTGTTAASVAPTTIAVRSGGPVKLRIADTNTGGPVKEWQDGVFKQFMAKFPNVTVEHTGLQLDQYKTALPLAVKAGQEADVFLAPFWTSMYRAAKDGWFLDISPYLDADFLQKFPSELWEEGTTVFNGKKYGISNVAFQPGGFLFYNKNLMRKAGLDPNAPPKTWSEFREQAKKLTQAGKGEFFGIVEGGKQLNRFMDDAGYLSSNAGGHSAQPGFSRWDYKTGKIAFDSDAFVAAVDLLTGMKNDNSFMPGFLNMVGNDAVDQFTAQKAGFFIYGPWNVQDFLVNKEIDFGVAGMPIPDSGRKGFLQYPRQAITVSCVSAKSKIPDIAVEYMKFRWGPETMASFVKAGLGSSAITAVNKPENYPTPQAAAVGQLVLTERRVPPDAVKRNPDASIVLEEYKDPSPDIQRMLQGVMSGQVTNYKAQAKELSDKMNAELDRAIKAAQDQGAKVTRNDWVFPNFDSTKDYDAASYKELG